MNPLIRFTVTAGEEAQRGSVKEAVFENAWSTLPQRRGRDGLIPSVEDFVNGEVGGELAASGSPNAGAADAVMALPGRQSSPCRTSARTSAAGASAGPVSPPGHPSSAPI